MNKTSFNYEALMSLVREMESYGDSSLHTQSFINLVRRMATLFQQWQATGDDEERQHIEETLQKCQREISQVFENICTEYGMTSKEVHEYVDDPQNFSQGDWEEVQEMRRRVEDTRQPVNKTRKRRSRLPA